MLRDMTVGGEGHPIPGEKKPLRPRLCAPRALVLMARVPGPLGCPP